MRYVPRLEPISVLSIEFTQLMFIDHLLEDPRFISSGAALRSAVRIEQAVRADTEHIAFEESDWATLAAVAEAPSHGYPSLNQMSAGGDITRKIPIARQLLPFVEAIVQAKQERPMPST